MKKEILTLSLFAFAAAMGAEDTILLNYSSGGEKGTGDAGGIITPWVTFLPELTDMYAGAQVKEVILETASKANNVQLYVKNLRDDNNSIISQKVGTIQAGEHRIALETPLELEKGKTYSFGYKATFTRAGGAVYGGVRNEEGCHAYYNTKTKWIDVDGSFCIGVVLTGDLPQDEAGALSVSDITLPPGADSGEMEIIFKNYGVKEISSILFRVMIDDVVIGNQECRFETPVASGATGKTTVTVPSGDPGRHTATFGILEVNGNEDVYTSNNTIGGSYIVMDPMFVRRVVCEEATGTWCSWCPRGIVGMEMMEEEYPGEFIGIAVHSGDEFAPSGFSTMLNKITSLPGCIVDRYQSGDPYQDIHNMFNKDRAIGSNISMRISPVYDDTNIAIHSTVRVSEPRSASTLNFAFIVVEDNVLGAQNNAYSGSADEMGGWEKLPSVVFPYYFNEIARAAMPEYAGASYLDGELIPGEVYEFDYSFSLPASVSNPDNVKIVGLVLDKSNGFILNADRNTMAGEYNAVETHEAVSGKVLKREVYTLDGVLIESTEGSLPKGKGMVIVREVTESGVTTRKFMTD